MTSCEGNKFCCVMLLFHHIVHSQARDVLYQTRETVFHLNIQTTRRVRGVWIADETLSRVFDISSQSKQKIKSKRRSKFAKIYAN